MQKVAKSIFRAKLTFWEGSSGKGHCAWAPSRSARLGKIKFIGGVTEGAEVMAELALQH